MQPSAPRFAVLSASHLAGLLLCVTAVHADSAPMERCAALMALSCSDLYVEAGCREALRSFDAVEPAQRAVTLARRCREAYCPLLPEPRPALCGLDLSQVVSTTNLHHFASFSATVLAFDLGPAAMATVHSALAQPPAIPVDAPAPAAAPSEVRLSARSIGGRLALELRGAQGTQSWRLPPPVTAARLAPLIAATRSLPPGTRAVVMADRRLPYGMVIALMDALRTAGLTRFAFEVDKASPP